MANEFVYGKNSCLSLIKKRNDIINVYIQNNYLDKKIIHELEANKIKYQYKDRKYLDKITDNANHQGIVIEVKGYTYLSLEELLIKIKGKENPLLLMLDGVVDPHIVGAILRTSEAIGVNGVIIPKNNSCPLNSTVAKTSTGAIDLVNIAKVSNLNIGDSV